MQYYYQLLNIYLVIKYLILMFKSKEFSLPFYRKEIIYENLFLKGCTCMHGRGRPVDDMGDVTLYGSCVAHEGANIC